MFEYLRKIFSLSLVLGFAIFNILTPNFLSINSVSASVDGIGASFSSGNGANWTATIYNDASSSYDSNQTITAQFGAYHCKGSSGSICSPNDTPGDFMEYLTSPQSVSITLPAKGSSNTMSFSTRAVNCGRVQVDLGFNGGILGGQTMSVGPDCGQPVSQPAPQPKPSCNVYTQPTTTCQGQQTCITNTTHNADCTTSTAQPVCQLVPGQCGYSLGQTPAQGSPAVSTPQATLPACPLAGQSGTQQLCAGQWGYNVCQVVERFSDGSPARYSCYFSQNSNCQGVISCPAPAAPVANQCRSISCSSAPAGCFYQNRLTFTCNPNDTLTCGNLVCNQNLGNPICTITASPPSGASPLNVNFTGNGSGGSGSISSYFWDLDGNGSYGDASGQSASRVYNSSANINLQVTDSNGRVGYCSTSINVTQLAPTPTPQPTAAPQVYQTFANVGVGTSAPAPVYYANVKQLPSTGLPLLAWAAAAFVPAGFKLRKLGKINKELADDPNYLWEEREYHRSIDSM